MSKLARLRAAAHLTQSQVAEEIGTHRSWVADYESERRSIRMMSLGMAAKLARVYGCHAEDLLDDEGSPDGNGKG